MEGRTDRFAPEIEEELARVSINSYEDYRNLMRQNAANFLPGYFPVDLRDPSWFPDLLYTGYNELASTLTYIDSASVAGGVSTFNRGFSYQSGVYCENCNF